MSNIIRYREQANPLCPNHIIYAVRHYIPCPSFASKTQRIQVGNGQYVSVLFIILVIVEIAGHRFEIYTLVLNIEGVFNS